MPSSVSVATSKTAKAPKEGFRFLRRDEGRLSYSQQIMPESPANAPSETSNGEVGGGSGCLRASSVPGRERRDSKALREAIAFDMRNAKSRDHLGKVVIALPKKTQPPSQGCAEENTLEEKGNTAKDLHAPAMPSSSGTGVAVDIRSLHPSHTLGNTASATAAPTRRSVSLAGGVGSGNSKSTHDNNITSSTHAMRNRARATSRGVSVSRPPWVDIDVPPATGTSAASSAAAAAQVGQPSYNSAIQPSRLTMSSMSAENADRRDGARRLEGNESRERWNAGGRGPYGSGNTMPYSVYRSANYDDNDNRVTTAMHNSINNNTNGMHVRSDELMERGIARLGSERGNRYADPSAESGSSHHINYVQEKNYTTAEAATSPALMPYAAGTPGGPDKMVNYFRRDVGVALRGSAAGDVRSARVSGLVADGNTYSDHSNTNINKHNNVVQNANSNYNGRNSSEEELVASLEKEVWVARQERERYLHLREMLDADREQHMQRQRLMQQELSEERAALQSTRERMQREAQKEVKAIEERYRNVSALLASERSSAAQLAQENESLRRQLESLTTAMRDGQAMQRAEATRLRREVDSLTRRNAELLAMTQEQQIRALRGESAGGAAATLGSGGNMLTGSKLAAAHILTGHAEAESCSSGGWRHGLHDKNNSGNEVEVIQNTNVEHRGVSTILPTPETMRRMPSGDRNHNSTSAITGNGAEARCAEHMTRPGNPLSVPQNHRAGSADEAGLPHTHEAAVITQNDNHGNNTYDNDSITTNEVPRMMKEGGSSNAVGEGVVASNPTELLHPLASSQGCVPGCTSISPLSAAGAIATESGTSPGLASEEDHRDGGDGEGGDADCALGQTPVVMDFTPRSGDAAAKKRRAREMEEHLRREDEKQKQRRQQRQQQQQQHDRASSLTPRSPRNHLHGPEGASLESATQHTNPKSYSQHAQQQQPVLSSATEAVRCSRSSHSGSLSAPQVHNLTSSITRRTASVSAAPTRDLADGAATSTTNNNIYTDATGQQDARKQRSGVDQVRSNSSSLVRRTRLGSVSQRETATRRRPASEKASLTTAAAASTDRPSSSVAAAQKKRVSSHTSPARKSGSRDRTEVSPTNTASASNHKDSHSNVGRQATATPANCAADAPQSTVTGAASNPYHTMLTPTSPSSFVSSAMRRIPTREELIGEVEPVPTEDLPNDTVVSQSNIGDNPNKHELLYRSGKRVLQYSNGTVKMILPSGHTILHFTNKDVKRTYPSGRNTYWYESAQTTHTQLPNGVQIFEFHATGQVERHLPDDSKEILYPDGSFKVVHEDGTDDVYFPQ